MATTAKFPTTAVTLAQLGAEFPNFPEAVLSGAHNAAVTTITLTAAVPAAWPTTGGWVTIDNEIIQYTGVSGSTLTVCTRASQSTTAVTHADAAKVGLYLTAATVNQIIAEIIAIETNLLGGQSNPNLVLNSDFSRRTVFGLAMPEVFADLSGTTKIDAGAAGAVASNIFTQGAANNEYAWCAASFVWRDGRASATFKATAIAGIYQLRLKTSASTWISVKQNNGNFTLTQSTATADVVQATTANVLTINRWYWIEVEMQGTTGIVKIYDTLGTVPGVTKASSTLVTTLTVAGLTAQTGWYPTITSDQAAAQWGGIATGNGGVYVETWLPESWAISFAGTLGGQAIGYDESADSGPLGKQQALRAYVPPAASFRAVNVSYAGPDGGLAPSTNFTQSVYIKLSGITGGNGTFNFRVIDQTSASATVALHDAADVQEAAWTRKTLSWTSGATARRFLMNFQTNVNNVNAGGTYYIMLGQLEQGSAATAWRGAEAGGDIFSYENVLPATNLTIASATLAELDSRDGAIEVFMPYDGTLTIDFIGAWGNSAAGNENRMALRVDGADTATKTGFNAREGMPSTAQQTFFASGRGQYAAGKHRVSVLWAASAGTGTMYAASQDARLRVTIQRGK